MIITAPASAWQNAYAERGWCQTKVTESLKTAKRPASASKLTPLGEGGGAIELEILASVEVAFLVEVLVN